MVIKRKTSGGILEVIRIVAPFAAQIVHLESIDVR